MTPPDVSVVVPVWDGYVRFLDECVASVRAQEGVAWELIVVDNASSVPIADVPGARTVRSAQRLSTGAARNRFDGKAGIAGLEQDRLGRVTDSVGAVRIAFGANRAARFFGWLFHQSS